MIRLQKMCTVNVSTCLYVSKTNLVITNIMNEQCRELKWSAKGCNFNEDDFDSAGETVILDDLTSLKQPQVTAKNCICSKYL